jgi:LysM repeat protein
MVNTIRSGLVFVVLGAVCYGAYVSLSTGPEPQPPPAEAGEWAAPTVDLVGTEAPATVLEAQPNRQEGEPTLAKPKGDLAEAVPWGQPSETAPPPAGEVPLRDPQAPPAPSLDSEQIAQGGAFQPGGAGADDPYLAPKTDGEPAAPPADSPAPSANEFAKIQDDMGSVQEHLNGERLAQALRELTQYLDHPRLSPQQQGEINTLLDQLAGTVIYDRNDHSLEPPYEVQQGEALDVIAERFNVPWQLLANINGINDPNSLTPGEKLKVLRGPFVAEVDLTRQQLVLKVEGMYAGRFNIGTEPDENLKPGSFKVQMRRETAAADGFSTGAPPPDANEPAGKWIELNDGQRIQAGAESPFKSHATRASILLSSQDASNVHDILSVGSVVVIKR